MKKAKLPVAFWFCIGGVLAGVGLTWFTIPLLGRTDVAKATSEVPDVPPSRIPLPGLGQMSAQSRIRTITAAELAKLQISESPRSNGGVDLKREGVLLKLAKISLGEGDEAAQLAADIEFLFKVYETGTYNQWLARLKSSGAVLHIDESTLPPGVEDRWEAQARAFVSGEANWKIASMQVVQRGSWAQRPAALTTAPQRLNIFAFGSTPGSPPPPAMDVVVLVFDITWRSADGAETRRRVGMELSKWPGIRQWVLTRSYFTDDSQNPEDQTPLPPL